MTHIKIIQDAFAVYGKQYRSLGDYSATTLIDPPRVVALNKRYGHLVVPTPESMTASMIGTAVHEKMESLLHMSNVINPDYMLERSLVHPFYLDFNSKGVMRLIAGKFDILHNEEDIYDLKTAKTWKLIFDPDMVDWHQQQNIYAYLLKQRGVEVKSLNIIAFYLDWIESKSLRDASYPDAPIVQYKLKLWNPMDTEEFIKQRLMLHVTAEGMDDDDLPECTMEERWERPPVFALMSSVKAQRATKLIKDGGLEDAIAAAMVTKGMSKDSYIEIRHEQRKRCDSYCKVNEYCRYYQEYALQKATETMNTAYPLEGVL